jgi:hypothetical protein
MDLIEIVLEAALVNKLEFNTKDGLALKMVQIGTRGAYFALIIDKLNDYDIYDEFKQVKGIFDDDELVMSHIIAVESYVNAAIRKHKIQDFIDHDGKI